VAVISIRHRFRGFSLAELAAVLFILAMLAAIAAPRVANTIRRQRLDNASRRLMVDLELVRSQAILDSADRTLTLSLAGQYYTLPTQVRVASECQVNLNVTPYEGVSITGVSYTPTQVTFNRLGLPQAGGSITLQSGSESAIITISSTSGRPTRTFGS
jgi:prepilin-type N-terminal cleavage/methylation domain-containing protein